MKRVYILWTCDEWKSRSSMRVRTVSTRRSAIEASVLKGIEAGDFDYTGTPDKNYRKNMAQEFLHHCRSCAPISDINAALRFGFIEVFEDGEEV